MSTAPPEKAGAASGASETSFEYGAALGVAVLGSIVTAVHRTSMAEVDLQGVPVDAIAAARDTLAAAAASAQALQNEASAALLTAARNAFTRSMQMAALLSAVLAFTAAISCARFLPRAPAGA